MIQKNRDTLKKWFSGSIFRNFIISYVVVFLIPFALVFSILYAVSVNIVQQNIEETSLATVNTVKRVFDTQKLVANRLASYLDTDYDLRILPNLARTEMTNSDIIRINAVQRRIELYFSTNSTALDGLYVYLPTSGLYISPSSSQLLIHGFSSLHAGSVLSAEQWMDLLEERRQHEDTLVSLASTRSWKVYDIQWLPLLGKQKNMCLIQCYNLSAYASLFDNALSNGGFIGIYDRTGSPILTNQGIEYALDFNLLDGSQGFISEHGRVVTWLRSSDGAYCFVSSMPAAYALNKLQAVQRIAIILFIISILLGASLIYFFTMRNYNPVKQLLDLAEPLGITSGKHDDYTRIRLALMEAIDDRRHAASQTRPDARLLSLIRSANDLSSLEKQFSEQGFLFRFNHYTICRITVQEFSDRVFQDQADRIGPILSVCRDLFQESFAKGYPTLVLNDDAILYIFLDLGADQLNRKNIIERLQELIDFMRHNYATELSALVGTEYGNQLKISLPADALYRLEMVAQRYRYTTTGNSIACVDDLDRTDTPDMIYRELVRTCQTLEQLLEAEEFSEAITLMGIVTNHMVSLRDKRGIYHQSLLMILYGSVLRATMHLSFSSKEQYLAHYLHETRTLHTDTTLFNMGSIQQMVRDLEIACQKKDDSDPVRSQLRLKIVDIVMREFNNPSLSVGSIADRFGLSIDLLSRAFKKSMEIGLLDYIHQVRIQKAKQLMKAQPDLTVYDVASQVGYLTCDSFIRAFKRLEQITPGKYKRDLN